MARFIVACVLAAIGVAIGYYWVGTVLAQWIGGIIGFLIPYVPDTIEVATDIDFD